MFIRTLHIQDLMHRGNTIRYHGYIVYKVASRFPKCCRMRRRDTSTRNEKYLCFLVCIEVANGDELFTTFCHKTARYESPSFLVGDEVSLIPYLRLVALYTINVIDWLLYRKVNSHVLGGIPQTILHAQVEFDMIAFSPFKFGD